MTVTHSSPIVGVFRDRSTAEQAIDALYNVGLTSEQIRYAAPDNSGSFLKDLKSLFTGQNPDRDNIANDLTTMGLSSEEAQYYANEYNHGNTVLAVTSMEREQEVLNTLRQYGAYSTGPTGTSAQTTYQSYRPQQPPDYDRQTASTDDSSQQRNTATWNNEQQASEEENRSFRSNQEDTTASTYDPGAQDLPPDSSSTPQNPDYQSTQQDTIVYVRDAQMRDYQANRANGDNGSFNPQIADAPTVQYPATQSPEASGEPTAQYSATQSSEVPDAQRTSDETVQYRTISSGGIASEHADEFEQLQAQLKDTQQQLQEARAQLQTAREHEAQLNTIKERQQQLGSVRQQLQEAQTELQATLKELQDTRGRISQYQ